MTTCTSTAPLTTRAPVRRFGQFGALTLALSWLPWIVLGVAGIDIGSGPGQIVFAIAAAGPSLAAGLLWLGLPAERIRGSGRPTWYGVLGGLLLGLAAPVLTALILNAGHPAAIPANAAAVTAGVGGPLGVIGYTLIAGPLAEEFGWRGYVQPRLRQRFGTITTTLVLGFGWACWHIPLFFLPGTGQHEIGLFTVGGLAFFITVIALSYLILLATERLRGGVWAAVAAHATFNAADALLPPHGTTGALLEMLIMVTLAVLAALFWRSAVDSG
ncbi:CPBP family intramembrane glutamic endopeptidase [Microlunatus soli]|uniref:CAAX protease self-immunity n=1 Tax=Microlunatus soli TaxID=630515 RepID=A0A1H1V6A2_9ACTN|nr:CPBP family intramembrane glutamic endopeptidase [Microlunatus soli]SDS80150.1 CAAX protease self-immunity [Microlunatus soli]